MLQTILLFEVKKIDIFIYNTNSYVSTGVFTDIRLDNNQLKRFESAVFKTPLNRPRVFANVDNNVNITGSNISW